MNSGHIPYSISTSHLNFDEPGLRIDVVEFGDPDQGVHRRGRHSIQPRVVPDHSLGCIVGQADPAVIKEAGEAVLSLEHVFHFLGRGVVF